jgi:hypothetical protein
MRITTRQRRQLLWSGAGLGAAAACALAAWGVTAPVSVAVPEMQTRTAQHTRVSTDPSTQPSQATDPSLSLGRLQRIAATRLRQPLRARQPTEESQQATEKAAENRAETRDKPLSVRLIGTINEPGHSMAMLEWKDDGRVKLCSNGQQIERSGERFEVTAVAKRKAVVRYAGQKHVLTMPRPEEGRKP